LTDLNSTNYSRVDGTKLEPNTPVPIKDGSRLQFGRVAVTFRI
jgi:pSer/pThr/pTyr-binding forkhead associated (FHA) protein